MHGRGHAWQGCVCGGGACVPWQIPWDTVNKRAVRILLECILVGSEFYGKNFGQHKKIICTATSTLFRVKCKVYKNQDST